METFRLIVSTSLFLFLTKSLLMRFVKDLKNPLLAVSILDQMDACLMLQ
jgi:hypothetical protein